MTAAHGKLHKVMGLPHEEYEQQFQTNSKHNAQWKLFNG
jgi:hypothetical protein